jgi:hypothetical protein
LSIDRDVAAQFVEASAGLVHDVIVRVAPE